MCARAPTASSCSSWYWVWCCGGETFRSGVKWSVGGSDPITSRIICTVSLKGWGWAGSIRQEYIERIFRGWARFAVFSWNWTEGCLRISLITEGLEKSSLFSLYWPSLLNIQTIDHSAHAPQANPWTSSNRGKVSHSVTTHTQATTSPTHWYKTSSHFHSPPLTLYLTHPPTHSWTLDCWVTWCS